MNELIKKETVLLALVTAFIYAVAYIDLWAESFAYKIPIASLSAGPLDLMVSGIRIGSLLVVLYLSLYFIVFCSRSKSIYIRILFISLRFLIAPLSVYYVASELSDNYWLRAVMTSIPLIVNVIWYAKNFGSIIYYLFEGDRKETVVHIKANSFLGFFKPYALLGSAIFFLVTLFLSSYNISVKEKVYNVFTKDSSYAVIKFLPDELVVKKIVKGKLNDGFFIFKKETLESIEITKKDITKITN